MNHKTDMQAEMKRVAEPRAEGTEKTPTFVNLEGLRERLLAPREIVRDEDGWLTHPEYPVCDEGTRADTFLEAFGIETQFVGMESDSPDLAERWHEDGLTDCSAWTPTPPSGNGWILLEIYDTEDGPYALFGRDAYAAEQEQKKERTRKLRADIDRVRAERAAAPQAEAAQGVPEGWTGNHEADSALIMLDRLDVSSDDDVRVDAISAIVRKLAAAPAPVSEPSPDREHEVPCAKLVGRWDYGKPGCVRYEPDFPRGDIPEGTPVYVGSAPSPDREQPPAENAGVRNKIADALHYPEHWDTAAYPTLDHAAWEAIESAKLTCSECAEQPSESGEQQDCGCEYGKPRCPKNCRLVAILAASGTTQQECPHGVDNGACGWCYDEATSGEQGAQVELPERVIDKLFQAAGVSTCGPDGEDILDNLHAFARNVVAETLARLPASAPTPITVLDDEVLQHARDMVKGHYPNHREYKVANALLAAGASTLGEQYTDERAAFEAWWNANETWPVAAKNLALLAWTTRANKPQPQAAEPKGVTPEWLWSEFMDYCKAQGRAPSEAKRLFKIVTRARALLANGE